MRPLEGNSEIKHNRKITIMVIMDGAADHVRIEGKSPLEIAETPNLDYITKHGGIGIVQTLYEDLPKDSVVAQLGLLGYDPYQYFPMGRSYFEVPDNIQLDSNDLIFRANFVHFDDSSVLRSYNGNGISCEEATKVVEFINAATCEQFKEFKLYHNSAFRNTLLIKNAGKLDFKIGYWEPHEEEGRSFLNQKLITAPSEHPLINKINDYIDFIYKNTGSTKTNGIFPWGYSYPISLPAFSENNKGCLIGNMDFLNGFSREMNLDFFKIGNSNWDTDYKGKGDLVAEHIESGNYDFIYCHINGPDEASHMNDIEKKVFSIEQIDKFILGPIRSVLETNPGRLNSVMVCPDHYTNINLGSLGNKRRDAHSMEPVPFILWNNKIKDNVTSFSEKNAQKGYYSGSVYNHMDLLELMNFNRKERNLVDVIEK